MKYIKLILILLIVNVASCVKYDALPFTGKVLPRRTGYVNDVTNDWLYLNLRTGEMFNENNVNEDIKEGEQYNRLDWDIAFCGYRIRTNSGTSGIGKACAADLGFGGYEKWKSVKDLPKGLKWAVDDSSVVITMSRKDWNYYLLKHNMPLDQNPWFDPNKGPATTYTSANPVLANAMAFSGPPPVFTPSFHTYVIRTADGKHYYKFELISWYRADVEIGDSGGELSYYCDELQQ